VRPGRRKIVAMVSTNGIPNPARSRTIGFYNAKLPVRPSEVVAVRDGNDAVISARVANGAEPPDEWQYLLVSKKGPFAAARGKPGQNVRVGLPPGIGEVIVFARPVVDGRPLVGQARATKLR